MTHSDELSQIRSAAAGNQLAQSELVTRHMPGVFRLAARTLGDRALAEDITQETFLRMWKILPRWEPQAKLSTWLHTVALNLCRDHYRKRRETLMDELPERVDPDLQPDAQLDQAQRTRGLLTQIDALPDRQREALTLCGLEGHTNIDAAEIMGVSVEALESLLARARRKLRATALNSSDD